MSDRRITYSDSLVQLARQASLAFLQECATHGSDYCSDNPLRSRVQGVYSRYLEALRTESKSYAKAKLGCPGSTPFVERPYHQSYGEAFDHVVGYAGAYDLEIPFIVCRRFAELDSGPMNWEAGAILRENQKGTHWLTCEYRGSRPTDQGYIHNYDVGHFPMVEMDRSAVEVWWPHLRYYVAPVLMGAPNGILHSFSYDDVGDPDPGTGELPAFGLWDPVHRPS